MKSIIITEILENQIKEFYFINKNNCLFYYRKCKYFFKYNINIKIILTLKKKLKDF
jgi:hypothetical protein